MFKNILLVFGLIFLSGLLIGCATNLSTGGVYVGLTPTSLSVSPNEIVKFQVDLISSGISRLKKTDVQLEHFLTHKISGKILDKALEKITLKGSAGFSRELTVPGNVVPGEYTLTTIARMENQATLSSFDFRIGDKEKYSMDNSFDLASESVYLPEIEYKLEKKIITPVIDVVIEKYKADPEKVTIKPFTKVRWTNHDPISHTITGAGFDSGPINQGDTFTHQFNESGLRYIYKSTLHNRVLGEIIVREGS